jgi:hypothetical protein
LDTSVNQRATKIKDTSCIWLVIIYAHVECELDAELVEVSLALKDPVANLPSKSRATDQAISYNLVIWINIFQFEKDDTIPDIWMFLNIFVHSISEIFDETPLMT